MATKSSVHEARAEIQRLVESVALRRQLLRTTGQRKLRTKKTLTVVAGVLALISAASFTAVLTQIAGDMFTKVFSVVLALTSGTLSLVSNAFYSDDEIVAMLTGSSRYLGLREKMRRVGLSDKISEQEVIGLLEAFQEEYVELDGTYSRFLDHSEDESQLSLIPKRIRRGSEVAQGERAGR